MLMYNDLRIDRVGQTDAQRIITSGDKVEFFGKGAPVIIEGEKEDICAERLSILINANGRH